VPIGLLQLKGNKFQRSGVLEFVLNLEQIMLQKIERDGCFVVQGQRRTHAYCRLATSQHNQTAREGYEFETITPLASRLARGLVLPRLWLSEYSHIRFRHSFPHYRNAGQDPGSTRALRTLG